jgi:hypothetical protein
VMVVPGGNSAARPAGMRLCDRHSGGGTTHRYEDGSTECAYAGGAVANSARTRVVSNLVFVRARGERRRGRRAARSTLERKARSDTIASYWPAAPLRVAARRHHRCNGATRPGGPGRKRSRPSGRRARASRCVRPRFRPRDERSARSRHDRRCHQRTHGGWSGV